MALNCSSCSIFPTSIIHADDGSCGLRCSRSQFEVGNAYGYGGASGGSTDLDVYDPADCLPADPFGMGIGSDIEAAIAGLMDFGANPYGYEVSGDQFIACYWKEALLWSAEAQLNQICTFDPYWKEALLWSAEAQLNQVCTFDPDMDEWFSGLYVYDAQDGVFESVLDEGQLLSSNGPEVAHTTRDVSLPHDGFQYALAYLGVKDLLSVEGVCRYLRSAVHTDCLLWRCIHVDASLCEKITDHSLWQLTQRAQGNLQCLSLAGCSRITDDGLKRVLEHNPKLTKLCVAECVRLSLDGIIKNLKAFKSSCTPGIKHLKLGRLFSISEEHFKVLEELLGIHQLQEIKSHKPRFYHFPWSLLACDDERYIDIETCPICKKYKLVYDCPSESCQTEGSQYCRACEVCIPRCVQCGKCIKDCRYVETFCLEYLCSACWKQPPSRPEIVEDN